MVSDFVTSAWCPNVNGSNDPGNIAILFINYKYTIFYYYSILGGYMCEIYIFFNCFVTRSVFIDMYGVLSQ